MKRNCPKCDIEVKDLKEWAIDYLKEEHNIEVMPNYEEIPDDELWKYEKYGLPEKYQDKLNDINRRTMNIA